jgi:uncharacterized protein YkuJ
MKKISFSQLESARKNPIAFVDSLSNPNGGTPRFSKFMAWQLAVHHYHKERGDLPKAINYFETTFMRNFADNAKNTAEREGLILELVAYSNDNKKKKLTYVEHKKRINIPLTGKIRLGGELPLIKMNNKGGYSIYFFSRESTNWEEELRFPIIQYFVATTLYNVDFSEVEVGIYSLELHKHLQKSYSKKEVDEAVKELNNIGRTISLAL